MTSLEVCSFLLWTGTKALAKNMGLENTASFLPETPLKISKVYPHVIKRMRPLCHLYTSPGRQKTLKTSILDMLGKKITGKKF